MPSWTTGYFLGCVHGCAENMSLRVFNENKKKQKKKNNKKKLVEQKTCPREFSMSLDGLRSDA